MLKDLNEDILGKPSRGGHLGKAAGRVVVWQWDAASQFCDATCWGTNAIARHIPSRAELSNQYDPCNITGQKLPLARETFNNKAYGHS